MFTLDLNWFYQQILNPYLLQINLGLIVIAVLLGYYALKKPVIACAGVVVLLPTYLLRAEFYGIPTTFLELSILIVFISWLTGAIRGQKPIRGYRYPMRGPITLILLAATISLFVSPDLRAAAGLWKACIIEPILFYLVLINAVQTDKDRRIVLWALGLSSLSVSILAIFQKFTGLGIAQAVWVVPESRRVTAMFTSPNAVGLFLGPIVAVYMGWMLQDITSPRPSLEQEGGNAKPLPLSKGRLGGVIKIIILAISLIAIIFTKSDGTVLGLTAAALFIGFFGISRLWTTCLACLAGLACLLIPLSRHKIIELLTFSDPSGQNRLTLWTGAWRFLTSTVGHFLLGAGIFGFPAIEEGFRDPLTLEPLLYPHNILLNFWVEYGILGLIGFSWLIWKFFRLNLRTMKDSEYRWLALGLMAAMLTIVFHGLIDVPYFKNDLAVLFWVIVGLVPVSDLKSTS